jgi:hypothetical protein
MKQLTSIALGFVLSVPAAGGDVYRWVDDRGQVHFGDRPPLQAQATRLPILPAATGVPAEDGLRPGERARLREIEQRESRETAEKKAREKQAAEDEKRRARQAKRDAQRCVDYRRKIGEYQQRLRAGCRISTCNRYQARIDLNEDKAAQVCHDAP